ncbi:hypothetical protein PINS_up015994 [Pythium insidiosum]|nr:hypothetical protein PINS_up015994 [Pythium insidiosum]
MAPASPALGARGHGGAPEKKLNRKMLPTLLRLRDKFNNDDDDDDSDSDSDNDTSKATEAATDRDIAVPPPTKSNLLDSNGTNTRKLKQDTHSPSTPEREKRISKRTAARVMARDDDASETDATAAKEKVKAREKAKAPTAPVAPARMRVKSERLQVKAAMEASRGLGDSAEHTEKAKPKKKSSAVMKNTEAREDKKEKGEKSEKSMRHKRDEERADDAAVDAAPRRRRLRKGGESGEKETTLNEADAPVAKRARKDMEDSKLMAQTDDNHDEFELRIVTPIERVKSSVSNVAEEPQPSSSSISERAELAESEGQPAASSMRERVKSTEIKVNEGAPSVDIRAESKEMNKEKQSKLKDSGREHREMAAVSTKLKRKRGLSESSDVRDVEGSGREKLHKRKKEAGSKDIDNADKKQMDASRDQASAEMKPPQKRADSLSKSHLSFSDILKKEGSRPEQPKTAEKRHKQSASDRKSDRKHRPMRSEERGTSTSTSLQSPNKRETGDPSRQKKLDKRLSKESGLSLDDYLRAKKVKGAHPLQAKSDTLDSKNLDVEKSNQPETFSSTDLHRRSEMNADQAPEATEDESVQNASITGVEKELSVPFTGSQDSVPSPRTSVEGGSPTDQTVSIDDVAKSSSSAEKNVEQIDEDEEEGAVAENEKTAEQTVESEDKKKLEEQVRPTDTSGQDAFSFVIPKKRNSRAISQNENSTETVESMRKPPVPSSIPRRRPLAPILSAAPSPSPTSTPLAADESAQSFDLQSINKKPRSKQVVPSEMQPVTQAERDFMRLSRKVNSILKASTISKDQSGLRNMRPHLVSAFGCIADRYGLQLRTEGLDFKESTARMKCATRKHMKTAGLSPSFFGVNMMSPSGEVAVETAMETENVKMTSDKSKSIDGNKHGFLPCYETLEFRRVEEREWYQQRLYGTAFVPQMLRGRTTLVMLTAKYQRKSTGMMFNMSRDREEFSATISKRYTVNKTVPRCDIPQKNWQQLLHGRPAFLFLHYQNREDALIARLRFKDDENRPLILKGEGRGDSLAIPSANAAIAAAAIASGHTTPQRSPTSTPPVDPGRRRSRSNGRGDRRPRTRDRSSDRPGPPRSPRSRPPPRRSFDDGREQDGGFPRFDDGRDGHSRDMHQGEDNRWEMQRDGAHSHDPSWRNRQPFPGDRRGRSRSRSRPRGARHDNQPPSHEVGMANAQQHDSAQSLPQQKQSSAATNGVDSAQEGEQPDATSGPEANNPSEQLGQEQGGTDQTHDTSQSSLSQNQHDEGDTRNDRENWLRQPRRSRSRSRSRHRHNMSRYGGGDRRFADDFDRRQPPPPRSEDHGRWRDGHRERYGPPDQHMTRPGYDDRDRQRFGQGPPHEQEYHRDEHYGDRHGYRDDRFERNRQYR